MPQSLEKNLQLCAWFVFRPKHLPQSSIDFNTRRQSRRNTANGSLAMLRGFEIEKSIRQASPLQRSIARSCHGYRCHPGDAPGWLSSRPRLPCAARYRAIANTERRGRCPHAQLHLRTPPADYAGRGLLLQPGSSSLPWPPSTEQQEHPRIRPRCRSGETSPPPGHPRKRLR